MNVTARSNASTSPCADSCISSTSPAKPTWKVAGIRARVQHILDVGRRRRPGRVPADRRRFLVCRTRCSRSMELGPIAGLHPDEAPCERRRRPARSIGAEASAMSRCGTRARDARGCRTRGPPRAACSAQPSTMLRTCVATDPTLKPRSAARARSTCATSSGWPDTSVVPTSDGARDRADAPDQLVTQALQLLHVVAAHVHVDRRLVGRPLHELGIGDLDLRKRDRLRRVRRSALMSSSLTRRSSFRVVCTRSCDLRIWPPVPTVVNTCRTSGCRAARVPLPTRSSRFRRRPCPAAGRPSRRTRRGPRWARTRCR